MNKVYVLTSREGTEMKTPKAFTSYEKTYKEMKTQYQNELDAFEDEDGEFGSISEWNAKIETSGDWLEWDITECDFEG